MEPIYIVLKIKAVEHEGGYAVVTSNTRLARALSPIITTNLPQPQTQTTPTPSVR